MFTVWINTVICWFILLMHLQSYYICSQFMPWIRALYLRVIGKHGHFSLFGVGYFHHRVHFSCLNSSCCGGAIWPGDLQNFHLVCSWKIQVLEKAECCSTWNWNDQLLFFLEGLCFLESKINTNVNHFGALNASFCWKSLQRGWFLSRRPWHLSWLNYHRVCLLYRAENFPDLKPADNLWLIVMKMMRDIRYDDYLQLYISDKQYKNHILWFLGSLFWICLRHWACTYDDNSRHLHDF